MDEHVHTPECEELRGALEDARARLEPPLRDTAVPLTQRVFTLEADTTPDASPALAAEIRQLEQSLRDMGCES